MAKLFQELKLHNKFPFEVEFLVMDPGYSPDNRHVIEENARKLGIPVHIFESDIFDAVYTIEKSLLPLRQNAPGLPLQLCKGIRMQQDRFRTSL